MIAHSFCHKCGSEYPSKSWPRECTSCGNMMWHNPTPIGVLLQTVKYGDNIGILTPVRGINPMRGYAALTGGFQEAHDKSSEDAGCRELFEEVGLARLTENDVELFMSRSCGPIDVPGARQNLVFSINHNPVDISVFENWVPNEETIAIEISWEPRILAFPTHTLALARYFEKYQGKKSPRHYTHQPRTHDWFKRNGEFEQIFDVPYLQNLLHEGLWAVKNMNEEILIIRDNGSHWEAVI